MENAFDKKKRKSLLLSTAGVFLAVTSFVFGYVNHVQMRLVQGGQPTYTITLNEENAPSSLGTGEFGDGVGSARYVSFDYVAARRSSGLHVILNENGSLANNANTKITSMKSITATFSGGVASLSCGPSLLLMNDEYTLTSGVMLELEENPYYFNLSNTGTSDLELTSLVIAYSCYPYYSTIIYVSNGGSAIAPTTLPIGASVSAPDAPTKPGYLFAGWYVDESLENEYSFSNMPQESMTLYAKWAFDADYPTISIADFKALDSSDTSFHFVRGVVLFSETTMSIITIADVNNMLAVMSNATVTIKDEIRVGGYRVEFDGFAVMAGNESVEVDVGLYNHDQAIPLAPQMMSVAAYNLLEPTNMANWMIYVEIGGTININDATHQIRLIDGSDEMFLLVVSQEAYAMMSEYNGFKVKFRGVILPNMDGPETELMPIFNGHEDFIDPDYENEELLLELEGMLRVFIEEPNYFPGQYVDLPLTHPLFAVTVSYELFGENASKFNLETNYIALDIEVALDIDLHVYVSITDGPNTSFDIKLHVDPTLILTIAEVRALPDSEETTRVTMGIVLNVGQMGEDSSILFIADETGVIHVNTNSTAVAVGDLIIAIGFKMTQSGNVYLFNDPSTTINRIIDHEQPFPIAPTIISLGDFNALAPSYVTSSLCFYELAGTLAYTNPSEPETSMFVLSDSGVNVFIYPVDAASRASLTMYVDQVVTIIGMAMVAGESGSEMIILFYIAYPGLLTT